MNRSDEGKKNSAGRATISTSEQWRTAAKELFGEEAAHLARASSKREPTVTCPKCLLDFVLLYDRGNKAATVTYEIACPRCSRPFRFLHVKQKPARKKKSKS